MGRCLPESTMRSRAAATCLVVALAAPLVHAQEGNQPIGRLRNVEIRTRDVFSEEEASANPFYWLADALHVVTREYVVERENWLRPGDELTEARIAELERNLRGTGLFGAVTVTPKPAADGQTDLLIDTRDHFSLNVSASASRVGGVNKYGVRASESNLLGTGKQIVFASSHEEGRYNDYFRFTDPQLLGTWHQLSVQTGRTEGGPYTSVSLVRPFKHLEDDHSYGVQFSDARENQDYYRFGEITAQIPLHREALRTFVASGAGSRDFRTITGIDLRLSSIEYRTATGPDAALWRVPGDTETVEVGPYWQYDVHARYDKVTHLDAIDYVEDLDLGLSLSGRIAARLRDEQGRGSDVDPVFGAGLNIAAQPLPETYATLAAKGNVVTGGDRLHEWNGSLALHAFQQSLPQQTLAASITYDFAGDTQDLIPQLTLGEDNGLRGYPAREFAGSRFARLNLEDRIDTGIEVLSIHLGVVGFCDVGWVHGPQQGLSIGEAIRGAGFGFRFGSSNLFGKSVGRLDFAWPLDEPGGNHYGMSVSFSIGQVFTFFGNANELNTGF
jgi:hypothetical protein